jgi:hypothetical protein
MVYGQKAGKKALVAKGKKVAGREGAEAND